MTQFVETMPQESLKRQLEALAHTTLDMDVGLEPGEGWGYHPGRRVLSYPREVGFSVGHRLFFGHFFRQVARAKYSDPRTLRTLREPRRAFALLLHGLEGLRVEARLQRHYPGTADAFQVLAGAGETPEARSVLMGGPDHLNVLANLHRIGHGLGMVPSSPRARGFLERHQVEALALRELGSTLELSERISQPLWLDFQRLLLGELSFAAHEGQTRLERELGELHDEAHRCDRKDACKDCRKEEKRAGEAEPLAGTRETGGCGDREGKSAEGGGPMFGDAPEQVGESDDETGYHLAFSDLNPALRRDQPSRREASDRCTGFEKARSGSRAEAEALGIPRSRHEGSEIYPTYEQLFDARQRRRKADFAARMKRVLRHNDANRLGGASSEGILQSSLLYRWRCRSNRVFARNTLRSRPDYAITLLIDESSSMRGTRIHHTAQAAVLLAEVLQAVQVPFQILGFNSHVQVYKHFRQAYDWGVKRQLEEIIPEADSWWAENTNDAGALALSSHFSHLQVGQHITLVLTDGRSNLPNQPIPAGFRDCFPRSCRSWSHLDIKDEVGRAMKRGLVIGIGINYPGIRETYPLSFVNREIEHLGSQVFAVLQKHMRRS
nr:VWA domain-containing protein [uncultured Holophaga sp.]